MIRLTGCNRLNYSHTVANKDATGLGRPTIQGGQTAQRGFFTSDSPGTPSMAGLGGDAFVHAGGLVCRSSNPIQRRHPHLDVRRGLTAIQGGHHA